MSRSIVGQWGRQDRKHRRNWEVEEGGSVSDEDVAHAGDLGEITRVRTRGPWSGHMLIALFDIKK